MAVVGKIKGVEITGGHLASCSVSFSDRLNCVIGSRGSGKTTLIEIIRLALLEKGESGLSSLTERLLKANLGSAQVRLSVSYDSAPSMTYTIIKTLGRERECESNGTLIETPHFPVSIYSTNEIEDIADDTDGVRKRELIDSFDIDTIREKRTKLAILRGQVRENTTAIYNLHEEYQKLCEEIKPLPALRDSFKSLQSDTQNSLDSEYRSEEEKERQRKIELSTIAETKTFLDAWRASTSEYLQHVNKVEAFRRASLAASFTNDDVFESLRLTIDEALSEALTSLHKTDTTIAAIGTSLDSTNGRLRERHLQQAKRYLDLQAQHAAATSKLSEISEIKTKIEALERKEVRASAINQELTGLHLKRKEILTELLAETDQLFSIRSEVARGINDSFKQDGEHPSIKVTVRKGADSSDYYRHLQLLMQGSKLQYNRIVPNLVQAASPSELTSRILDKDVEWLAQIPGIDQRANQILDHLNSQYASVLNLVSVEIDDGVEIALNIASTGSSPEYRESSELSTGQKCTAILPILLLVTEQGPLIIDQPENNLDNQYIFSYVIPQLRATKSVRQLIFITHNPNIPVLADSENVIVIAPDPASDGVKGTIAHSGDLESSKEHIIALLEGGAEAFSRRHKIYGLS